MLDLHFKLFNVVLLVHFSMFCFEIVEEFEQYKDTIRKSIKNPSEAFGVGGFLMVQLKIPFYLEC